MKAIRFLNTLRNGLIQKKTLKYPLEQEKKKSFHITTSCMLQVLAKVDVYP